MADHKNCFNPAKLENIFKYIVYMHDTEKKRVNGF